MNIKLANITLRKFYKKNEGTISLNKNLLISGIVGFIVSIIVAYYSAKYSTDDFVNSALTVIIGFVSSKFVFGIFCIILIYFLLIFFFIFLLFFFYFIFFFFFFFYFILYIVIFL